ncbi:MAG: MBL fold metallo-hydrolase [Lachnospiraceae bacterium]|nr:MBL fold metallo-hydrolase [Lachnospiraceae bacterium]
MYFASIASGSSGNCLLVGNDDTRILIDAGVSKKRIEAGLRSYGLSLSDITAVVLTHEHSDHVKGLGVLSRAISAPIYGTRGTINAVRRMQSLGKVNDGQFNIIKPGQDIVINNVRVHSFSVPHDAADPVDYSFFGEGQKIGAAADLGYFDDEIVRELSGCDLLYIEANHDLRMLETGPYPYQLKMRIAGNYGHLSNEDSGQLIGRVLNEGLGSIILGHLSKENNYPDLALKAVENELLQDFPEFGERERLLQAASREEAGNLIKIRR